MEFTQGEIYMNNQGCEYVILEKVNKKSYLIEFLDEHKYQCKQPVSSLKRGAFVNPYGIVVNNKGYYGNIDGLEITSRERTLWRDLVNGSSEYDERWNSLEYFITDVRQTENYELWLNDKNYTMKKIIEKGIVIGYKVIDKIYAEKGLGRKVKITCIMNKQETIFPTITKATEELGLSRTTLYRYCNANKIANGFKFEFLDLE
jgi:hypothetical protein